MKMEKEEKRNDEIRIAMLHAVTMAANGKEPEFCPDVADCVGTNRASGAHPYAWYHRRWLLVSRFPGNTTILPEVGHQYWDPLEHTIKGF